MAKKSRDDTPRPSQPTAQLDDASAAAVAASAPQLAAGEVLAGRYRIVRYLARGGMGEVYEAEDLELGERIALKTIREGAREGIAEERFKREIQLARKVTHPNVCRIFDVGFHTREDGKQVVFLTMELLRGETLFDHLRHEGKLSIGETTDLLRQLVAGLSTAHAVGVIHRDLKSTNVLLVPKDNGRLRAVITDFGLAHVLGGSDSTRTRSMSSSGIVVGTPGYMAPEQIEGGALSVRTDVYAIGVLLYEMLTGALPFEGGTPMSIAAKRLTTLAPSPRKRRADLPAKWDKVVLACLERDAADRPETARAVLEQLGLLHDSYEELDGTMRVSKSKRRVPLVRPAIVLLAIVLSFIAVRLSRERTTPGARRAVATLPFQATDIRARAQPWVGAIAAELIAVTLQGNDALHSFDSESVNAALGDVGVRAGDAPTAEQLQRLSEQLALDLVVTGRFRVAEDGVNVTVEAELRNAHTRRALVEVAEKGRLDDLAAALDRVARRVGQAAGVPLEQLGRGIGVTLPRNPAALRAYIEAKQKLERREARNAVDAAMRGITDDPENARLRLVLAEAYAESGDERHASEQAKEARRCAASLPRLERLFVEAAASVAAQDRVTAIAYYEQLRGEMPNDPEVLWRLVDQLTLAGRASEALQLIEQLRRMSLSRTLELRVDELEVEARIGTDDLDRALVVARGAVKAADAIGARQWRARGRYKECLVLDSLRRLDEARAACEETRHMAADAGERRLRGQAVNLIANIDLSQGKLPAARSGYEETLEVFRDLGDRSGEAMVLNNLGAVESADMDRDAAARLWRQSLAIADELHDAIDAVPTRENLSEEALERLDWKSAIVYAEDAQRTARATDDAAQLVEVTCRVASLYLDVGRGADADRQIDDLEAMVARFASPPSADLNCELLRAEVEVGRGHLDAAVRSLREATGRVRAAQETSARALLGEALAHALVEAGDHEGALAALDTIGEHATARIDDSALRAARMLRLRIELDHGPVARMPAQLRELELGVHEEPDRHTALAQEIELERLRARAGAAPLAVRHLNEIAIRATRLGAVSLGLEAELYADELSRTAGARPSHANIVDYAKRARAAGRPGWAERAERLAE
jgi:tetratricopeptide (TPR) repeat protein